MFSAYFWPSLGADLGFSREGGGRKKTGQKAVFGDFLENFDPGHHIGQGQILTLAIIRASIEVIHA